MSWKRNSALTSVGTNVLLLALPGGYYAWYWMQNAGKMGRPEYESILTAAGVTGSIAVALAACCIVCVRNTYVSEGRRQRKWTRLGLLASGAVLLYGVVLSYLTENAMVFFLPAIVVYTTIVAVRQPTHEPTPDSACDKCGYDLAGLEGEVCPECGMQVRPEAGM